MSFDFEISRVDCIFHVYNTLCHILCKRSHVLLLIVYSIYIISYAIYYGKRSHVLLLYFCMKVNGHFQSNFRTHMEHINGCSGNGLTRFVLSLALVRAQLF